MANFRTGDTVHHNPSGEDWIVAVCEDGKVIPCGWPLTFAESAHCELMEAATDEECEQLMQRLATISNSDDPRRNYARRVLAEQEAA